MKIMYFYDNYNFFYTDNNGKLCHKSSKYNYLSFKNFILLFLYIFRYCDFTFRNLKKVSIIVVVYFNG